MTLRRELVPKLIHLRQVLIDEREGPVLEFSRKDPFAVHVRHLLDLQCTLQARSVCNISEALEGLNLH